MQLLTLYHLDGIKPSDAPAVKPSSRRPSAPGLEGRQTLAKPVRGAEAIALLKRAASMQASKRKPRAAALIGQAATLTRIPIVDGIVREDLV